MGLKSRNGICYGNEKSIFDDCMIHGIGGTMVGVGKVWHTIATLIIYQRRMGAQMGKGRENNGF